MLRGEAENLDLQADWFNRIYKCVRQSAYRLLLSNSNSDLGKNYLST